MKNCHRFPDGEFPVVRKRRSYLLGSLVQTLWSHSSFVSWDYPLARVANKKKKKKEDISNERAVERGTAIGRRTNSIG